MRRYSKPSRVYVTTGEANPHRQGSGKRPSLGVIRLRVLKRDNYRCQYCGDLADSVDHIIPYTHGGSDSPANLITSCRWCNSTLSNKYFDDGVDGKRLYIAERLHLKKAWFRKRHSICGDCHQLFRPNINGATAVLCSECYAVDDAGVNGDLAPETVTEREAYIDALNEMFGKMCGG